MIFAPVLQDVAARVAGVPAEQLLDAPARWAYALRDAVALAAPDWVVTHHDLDLEAAAAIAQVASLDDLPDVTLTRSPGGAAVLALTSTLAGLYPGGVVASSLTGPATLAARTARHTGAGEPDLDAAALDGGDVLASFAIALVERGAGRVIVWEPDGDRLSPDLLVRAHEPILRTLRLAGIGAVAVGSEHLAGAGYAALAWPAGGRGAAVLRASDFQSPRCLADRLIGCSEGTIVLSNGPVPGDCDLTTLRRLGERTIPLEPTGGTR